ncbi:MAG TPA: GHKL domain-containing protein, partial [Candidatus Portnoybacteria bacterium]|nr:GHKL domain-containing protein [Candidatus Portnoybacteria bacterium]
EGKILSHFSVVNIKNLIKFIIDIYQENVKRKELKIDFKTNNKISNIEADPEKLSIAIKNLIDNAISYSPNNSIIEIIITDQKKNIAIQITNSNQGILPSEKSRLFSKFFRGQNAIKMETVGSGLGLFISKNIIEAHHGTITFNLDQQNIIFTVTLPIHQK